MLAACQHWTYYCAFILLNHCRFRFGSHLKSCFLHYPVYPLHSQISINCFLWSCVDLLLPSPQLPWNFFSPYVWAVTEAFKVFLLCLASPPPSAVICNHCSQMSFSCFRVLALHCSPSQSSWFWFFAPLPVILSLFLLISVVSSEVDFAS